VLGIGVQIDAAAVTRAQPAGTGAAVQTGATRDADGAADTAGLGNAPPPGHPLAEASAAAAVDLDAGAAVVTAGADLALEFRWRRWPATLSTAALEAGDALAGGIVAIGRRRITAAG
jgi:hypothetical protein